MKQTNAEQQTLSVKSVQLNQKQSAAFLIPELNDGQKLAVVDEGVLKFLTNLLPTAEFWEIRDRFINDIRNTDTLVEMVACAKQEVVFHESCNLLSKFFNVDTKVEMEAPFNVVKPEPTFDDLVDEYVALKTKLDDELIKTDESIDGYIYRRDYVAPVSAVVEPVEVAH